MTHFTDRLYEAVRAKGSPVCAGIDPRPDMIPQEYFARAFELHGKSPEGVREAVRGFCLEVLEIVAPHVPAVKPQAAFFEALGPGGFDDLAAICARARELGLLVIADVKRGDIGSTAEAYAQGLFGDREVRGARLSSIMADAATINPYLGADGIVPFIERAQEFGAGVYVLARTSNPGSAEFQQLPLKEDGTLVDEVARKIDAWGSESVGDCTYSDVGAVVGATHVDAARRMRELMPRTPFLVPGWGAQGGHAEAVKACFGGDVMGAIVSSSRGVMHAYASGPLAEYGETRWKDAVDHAARNLNKEIRQLCGEPRGA